MTGIYKFVDWEVPTLEQLKDAKAVKLRQQIDNGQPLSRQDKDWITKEVKSNMRFSRAIPVMGWCIPFADVLHRFIVRQHGRWHEVWAIDKTAIRHTTNGRIDEIVELKIRH